MGDPLYARLNARGHKQFKGSESIEFEESYPDYDKIGLPAHKAALDGNLSCLRDYFLSKHQQDEGVPSRDVNGATPVHLASRTNRIEVVRWLLRFTDLSPIMAAKHGETPAHVAAAQGNVDCLKVMVTAEGKSDIKSGLASAVDNSGYTALHLAIVKFRNDCAKLLIAELGVKGVGTINESGITAAHVAASSGNIDILKLLSQKHKKLMIQEAADGTTPVYFAAQEGRLEALKFLATKLKCDLTTASNDGLKPIHAASQCGHTHIIKFIVSHLGNPTVFDATPDGATSLHFAASSGQIATARWLLNCDLTGSLISSKDKNGDTAAHDAAESGQTSMLKCLLESGADLYAINSEGNTPYSLALSGQYSETANFVMTFASKAPQKQESGPTKMTIYDMQGDVDIVDLDAASAITGPIDAGGKDEPDTTPPQLEIKKPDPIVVSPAKKSGSKKGKKEKEKKEKEKKEKGKDKKMKKSNSSFTNNVATTEVLNSLDSSPPDQPVVDDNLDMTEEDLAQFQVDNKPPEAEIVVRYSAKDPPPPISSYSTVGELAESDARKKKKDGRKLSKSIQKALKPGKKKVSDSKKQSASNIKEALSGPEMGFKPQFKTNPLQKIPGLLPATPPPTPATGASIAPSEEIPQNILDDVDEEEDGDEGNPYDSYSTPGVSIDIEAKEKQEESEIMKLLGDTLDDLSGEDSPLQEKKHLESSLSDKEKQPSPKAEDLNLGSQNQNVPKPEDLESSPSEASMNSSPKLKPGVWPPPSDDVREQPDDSSPPLKSGHPSVLQKWQPPKEWKKEERESTSKPSKLDMSSWAKSVKKVEVKRSIAQQELEALKKSVPKEETKPLPPPIAPKAKKEKTIVEEVPKNVFVALKPVKKHEVLPTKQEDIKIDGPTIKLKRSGGKKGIDYTKPEDEPASGASDELLKYLRGRQN